MSADNWAICPRCKVLKEAEIRSMDEDIARSYGSAPIEEFDRLRSVRDALANEEPKRELREDYEIYGVEDGELYVSYSGHCMKCGFSHVFKHEETIEVNP